MGAVAAVVVVVVVVVALPCLFVCFVNWHCVASLGNSIIIPIIALSILFVLLLLRGCMRVADPRPRAAFVAFCAFGLHRGGRSVATAEPLRLPPRSGSPRLPERRSGSRLGWQALTQDTDRLPVGVTSEGPLRGLMDRKNRGGIKVAFFSKRPCFDYTDHL